MNSPKPCQIRFDGRSTDVLRQFTVTNSELRQLLTYIKQIEGYDLWLGGGCIRNKVWDVLHHFSDWTTLEDVDVVYFDGHDTSKVADVGICCLLHAVAPQVAWSVKNQARMHVVTGEPPCRSFEDAIEKWPETATAMAAKFDDNDKLELLAPHGVTDLFDLKVRPTPYFKKMPEKYEARLEKKRWKKHWHKLDIEHILEPGTN